MITQNELKRIIFIVVPKKRKQLKVLSTAYVSCSYKDNYSSDKSKNNDNDKDDISDNDNNIIMKLIQE